MVWQGRGVQVMHGPVGESDGAWFDWGGSDGAWSGRGVQMVHGLVGVVV